MPGAVTYGIRQRKNPATRQIQVSEATMAIGAPMTRARIASGISSATTIDPIAITKANFTINAMAMNGSARSFSGRT